MGEKVWASAGYACGLASCLLIMLAFSTPNWIETENVTSTQLDKLGLWEMCFVGYSDQKDGIGRIYNGCWWIFAREYDGIRQYLLPEWFVATQALLTVCVVLTLLGAMFGLFLLIGCLPSKMLKWAGLLMCLGHYLAAIMMAVALIYFGTNAGTSRSWLKQPTLRYLSWSFYCAVIGALFSIPAGGFYNVYYILVRRMTLHSTAYRAHEMRQYQASNAWRSDMGYRSETSYPQETKSNRDSGRDAVDYRNEPSYRNDRVSHKSRREYESERDYGSERSYDSDHGRRSERNYRQERSRERGYDDRSRDRGYDDRGYDDRGHESQRSHRSNRGHSSDRGHRSERSDRRSERSYR